MACTRYVVGSCPQQRRLWLDPDTHLDAIPPTRIYVSELGLNRQAPGAPQFLQDLLAVIQPFGWHWSFYSFREDDSFPAMDYELGTGPTPAKYWSSFRGEGLPGRLELG